MRKLITILIPALFLVQFSIAQPPAITILKPVSYDQLITAGPSLPLAQFGETHLAGITASYIRKKERFSQQEPYNRKKTGWIRSIFYLYYSRSTYSDSSYRRWWKNQRSDKRNNYSS